MSNPKRKKRRADLWLQGYGVALANVIRCTHDYSVVEVTMKADGITLDMLVRAGLDPGDTAQLIPACRKAS